MDADFWHSKWKAGETGFHYDTVHPMLDAHIGALNLSPAARVFLPLCGKTGDIDWLLGAGYRVAGAELSEAAVQQLFARLGVTPDVTKMGELLRYQAPQIDIFVGDIFVLTPTVLGQVDAVYDRAAMVALPHEMRNRYARLVAQLTNAAPQLLITFTYAPEKASGPPFSVTGEEIATHYEGVFRVTERERKPVGGGPKGVDPTDEVAWLLF